MLASFIIFSIKMKIIFLEPVILPSEAWYHVTRKHDFDVLGPGETQTGLLSYRS